MITHFQKVSVKGVKRWTDESGKKRQKTKEFWQTISPFNKRADGTPKTYIEILNAVKAERDAWLAQED